MSVAHAAPSDGNGTLRKLRERTMHKSAIVMDRKLDVRTEVVAELNALFLMVSYVELELERIAPECILAASNLRSSILSEMLTKMPN